MRKCDTGKKHRQISEKTAVRGARRDVIIQNENEKEEKKRDRVAR
jgi:hypothetical protein